MKKKLLIGISLLMCALTQAQEKEQYLYVLGGGGVHNLSYTFPGNQNTINGGLGYQLSIGYSYFFDSHWGLNTGIGIQSFNSSSKLNFSDSIVNQIDAEGEKYKYFAQYNNWTETQQSLFFDIPLNLLYRLNFNSKTKLLLGLGGKVSFPIYNSYKITDGNIVTSGYYERYNLILTDLPQDGFPLIQDKTDSYYNLNKSIGYNLKPAFMLLFDLGITREIHKNLDFYIGGYLNYGLNNILNLEYKNITSPGGYDQNTQKFVFNYNGVLAANQIAIITPVSFGIKLGLYIKVSPNKTPKIINELQEKILRDTVIVEKEIIKSVYVDRIVNNTDSIGKTKQQYVDFVTAIKNCSNTIIQFKATSAIITKYDQIRILELSNALKANKNMILHIIGHTDNLSSHEFNIQLGLRRAEEVKQKFIDLGVNSSQLKTESKGFDHPIAPNNSEINREKNRRVQLEIDAIGL